MTDLLKLVDSLRKSQLNFEIVSFDGTAYKVDKMPAKKKPVAEGEGTRFQFFP